MNFSTPGGGSNPVKPTSAGAKQFNNMYAPTGNNNFNNNNGFQIPAPNQGYSQPPYATPQYQPNYTSPSPQQAPLPYPQPTLNYSYNNVQNYAMPNNAQNSFYQTAPNFTLQPVVIQPSVIPQQQYYAPPQQQVLPQLPQFSQQPQPSFPTQLNNSFNGSFYQQPLPLQQVPQYSQQPQQASTPNIYAALAVQGLQQPIQQNAGSQNMYNNADFSRNPSNTSPPKRTLSFASPASANVTPSLYPTPPVMSAQTALPTDEEEFIIVPRYSKSALQKLLTQINDVKTSSATKVHKIACNTESVPGVITLYENDDFKIRQMGALDVYDVCRKSDIKYYVDLLTAIAGHYTTICTQELELTVPGLSAPLVSQIQQFAKRTVDAIKHVNEIGVIYVTKCIGIAKAITAQDGSLEYSLDDEVTPEQKKTSLDFITSFKRQCTLFLMNFVNDTRKLLLRKFSEEQIEQIASQSEYFKLNLADIQKAYQKTAAAVYISTLDRKVLVQEILVPNSLAASGSNNLTTTLPSSMQSASASYMPCSPARVVMMPMNILFDKYLYSDKKVRCTKDRFSAGLCNGYKTMYIKNGTVMWEAFRTGSIPAIRIKDTEERRNISLHNATELLRAVASNHCKKYSREELLEMAKNGSIEIPFTSVCLLTPFFLTDREDRQLIEHHQNILDAIPLVTSVTFDLGDKTDNGKITVPVEFKDTVLLNFGTNVIMKTFLIGIGMQRVINVRRCGMRLFEKKVLGFLDKLNKRKEVLRGKLSEFINQQLDLLPITSRTSKFYQENLLKRLYSANNAYFVVQKLNVENEGTIRMLDMEMESRQSDLEEKVNKIWIPTLGEVAKSELCYQQHIKPLVTTLEDLHFRINTIETNPELVANTQTLLAQEEQLLTEVRNIVYSEQTPQKSQRNGFDPFSSFSSDLSSALPSSSPGQIEIPSYWLEYKRLVQLERDVQTLFSDLRKLYHSKAHEKWVQGLLESSEVKDLDPYLIPTRILTLGHIIGQQCHFNCKSGKDRTGECNDQCIELAEIRQQYGEYTSCLDEKNLFGEHRRQIHTVVALNGGSLQVIKENLGIPGSKTDASVSGRFIKGFFKKYKGLAKYDTCGFASDDKFWNNNVVNVCGELYVSGGNIASASSTSSQSTVGSSLASVGKTASASFSRFFGKLTKK